MTPAEQNRAVAELCGYELLDYQYPIIKSSGKLFDPLNNPAQAIEALDRVFGDLWQKPFRGRDQPTVIIGMLGWKEYRGEGNDPDPVNAFCKASVAAILAAGGKS